MPASPQVTKGHPRTRRGSPRPGQTVQRPAGSPRTRGGSPYVSHRAHAFLGRPAAAGVVPPGHAVGSTLTSSRFQGNCAGACPWRRPSWPWSVRRTSAGSEAAPPESRRGCSPARDARPRPGPALRRRPTRPAAAPPHPNRHRINHPGQTPRTREGCRAVYAAVPSVRIGAGAGAGRIARLSHWGLCGGSWRLCRTLCFGHPRMMAV